jgi:hypothetical protein
VHKIIAVFSMIMLLLTACSMPDYDGTATVSQTHPPPQLGAVYTQYSLVGGIGSLMENDFIKYKVNEIDLHYDINGKIPENTSFSLLRINITVTNKIGDSIPVSAGDFVLNTGRETVKPLADITPNQFPVNYQLAVKGQIEGDLFFRVPYGQTDFALEYTELLISNGVTKTGNTYTVVLSVDLQDKLERLSEVRKNSSYFEYKYSKPNEVVRTKFFTFTVNSSEIKGNILKVNMTILTDSSTGEKLDISNKDWVAYNGEMINCINDGNYMLKKQTLSPDLSYDITLGFDISQTTGDNVYILEYTEYDLEKMETIIYGQAMPADIPNTPEE